LIPDKLEIKIKGVTYFFDTKDMNGRMSTYNKLYFLLKHLRPKELEKVLANIMAWADISPYCRKTYRTMTIEEVIKLSKSKIANIGTHTHNHPMLSILSYNEQIEEIKISKALIEDLIGKEVVSFSYPYGEKKDYNRESIKICKNLGFKVACASFYGQVHSWSSVYELPRCLVRDWDLQTFKNRVKHFFRF